MNVEVVLKVVAIGSVAWILIAAAVSVAFGRWARGNNAE